MFRSVRRIIALARLIILDSLRRYALIGLILFALSGICGGLLFIDFIPRDIGRAANDFLFSIIWITGFILLLFHAVQVMSWDNERGILHTYLARPITRKEYAMSLFLGLAALLLALNIILGALGWGILIFIKNSVKIYYFQHLSFVFFLLSSAGLYWIQLIILSVILLFSSSVRGSLPVLLLTLCYYFICSGLPVVRESLQLKIHHDSDKIIILLLKWLTAIFPDFSWLDFKILVASEDPVLGINQIALPFILSTLYIIIVLTIACEIYKRRDLQ